MEQRNPPPTQRPLGPGLRSPVGACAGLGPGIEPAIGSTPVGGDDFHEYIDLTETHSDGHTLIGLIREYTADNAWLVITAMSGRFEISLTTTSPRMGVGPGHTGNR